MENRRLRAALLDLQDRLSNEDRQRLHFYLQKNVPRTIADNLTLNGTLRLIDALFDQDKINDKNFNLLIDALTQIRCSDAASTLKNYQHRRLSKRLSGSAVSLESIMPHLADSEEPSVFTKLFDDNNEEDKGPTNHLIVNEINQKLNNNNHNMIHSNNVNINRINVNPDDQKRSPRNRFFRLSARTSKMLMLIFFVISCVLATLLILMKTGTIESTNSCPSCRSQYLQRIEVLNTTVMEYNITIEGLNDQLEKLKDEQTTHLIQAGRRFGGEGGGHFDDSTNLRLTPCHYLSGIVMSENLDNVDGYQFIYKSACVNRTEIISEIHGNGGHEIKPNKQFSLDPDEKINRVEVKVNTVTYHIEGTDSNTSVTKLVRGIRFFTTKSRSFPPSNHLHGETEIETYPGYTLGYVTGQQGLAIDQIQFYWYRT